jgi:pilus assembly protein CpaC
MPRILIFRRWLRTAMVAVTVSAAVLPGRVIYAQPPATPQESTPASPEGLRPGEHIVRVTTPRMEFPIVELQSRVVELDSRIQLVDDFNPETVSVVALSPTQLRVRGEAPGVTTVRITDEHGSVYLLEVFVERDVRELQAHIDRLFPGSAVQVVGVRDSVILRGWVTQPDQIPQIIDLAETFGAEVQNHIEVGGGNLVQLSVKVMEVQRSKLEALGFNFLALGQDWFVASTPGGLAPVASTTLPFGGPPSVTTQQSALGNTTVQFAILGNDTIFEGFLEALKQESLLKILAKPVVTTTSGRPAEIHSGGEFPILVPQGIGTATIQFRQFGVRMETVPIVLGHGRVQLDIAAEVSERDFSNSVDVSGFRVPGITSRDVNTRVEMNFGETLMIGGLISDRLTVSTNKVPYLGDVPWLGAAFSRKNYQIASTELVILVTPHLVSPIGPGQLPCGGPGMSTDTPTTHEIWFDGHVEVPVQGPDCPACPPGAPGPIGVGPGMPVEAASPAGISPGAMPPGGMPPTEYYPGVSPEPLPILQDYLDEPGTAPELPPAPEGDGREVTSAAYRGSMNRRVTPAGYAPGAATGARRGNPGMIEPRPDFIRPTPRFVGGSTP